MHKREGSPIVLTRMYAWGYKINFYYPSCTVVGPRVVLRGNGRARVLLRILQTGGAGSFLSAHLWRNRNGGRGAEERGEGAFLWGLNFQHNQKRRRLGQSLCESRGFLGFLFFWS